MNIPIELVKELRAETGAGVLQCREALEVNDGDLEKATIYLREKGLVAAAKKAGREASEGIVEAYGHPGGRVGVLVEVNCETDFVARTDKYQEFVHDMALQVAAMQPLYVTPEDVPAEVLESKKEFYRQQALQEGKPEHIVERIVDDLQSGRRDVAEFWIQMEERFVHIRYFAVRDDKGEYLGTLEVTQDIAPLRDLEGERRLLAEMPAEQPEE